ncbi:soil-associated protein, TIGR03435 family [Bryocella elongata]|uniref:Soil-associated protein, TIGR03435 family n=1 Tax=Bryocella elongata TaxID=863522 RepID=A0A1H5T3E7_9BACT|nr:TIGR03435 family protein [Bryocella elongata]SEF56611.1 soil-associated protein, TIGR03435 family [Bryocella elongata]
MIRHLTKIRYVAAVATVLAASVAQAQTPPRPKFEAFEVATVKLVDHDPKGGRYFRMEDQHRWIAKDYTLPLLIAAAYDLNTRTISGGPDWIDSAHFDIVAITPGTVQPNRVEQMAMLRKLLADQFQLTFHRQSREFALYELQVARGGPKLKESTAPADEAPKLITTVYPPAKLVLPARNATMQDFVFMLQRAMLDRPVTDKTGLTARYDFDLTWSPDETQFGGEVPVASPDAPSPPLFTALQQQLGLKLVAARGPINALVIDHAVQPSSN